MSGDRQICRVQWPGGWLVVVVCTGIGVSGCRDSADASVGDDTNLRGIARVYAMAARDLGRAPASVEELQGLLVPVMEDPTSVFRSSRDGEPFVIVWGLDMAGKDLNTRKILAYERKGDGGTRLVLDCRGEVQVVPEEVFAVFASRRGLEQLSNSK